MDRSTHCENDGITIFMQNGSFVVITEPGGESTALSLTIYKSKEMVCPPLNRGEILNQR